MERYGGCACGAVRFVVTAPFMAVGACHCTDCQKASGGGPNYVALAPKDAFAVTVGDAKVFRRRGDSSAETQRSFSGECGTPLWGIPSGLPFMTIKLGALDHSADLVPQLHLYVLSAQPWHQFGEGLPKFEKLPPLP